MPRARLAAFMERRAMRSDPSRNVVYGTVRLIERDDEVHWRGPATAMPASSSTARGPSAEGIEAAADTFRALIDSNRA